MSLVLVATPIGNLGDLAPRAIEVLGSVDVIACEDTRRTGRLLSHFGVVRPPFIVVNEHTETARTAEIIGRLDRGERVALVSDAGMPTLSDPGNRLVRSVLDAGHTVEVVPGPSAPIAALAASGLPTDRFVFEGFLPRRGSERKARLAELSAESRTIVLLEAPHRLHRTIVDLGEQLGPERPVVLARELTKLHEEIWRGSLTEAASWAAATPPRGEFVVVLAGAPDPPPPSDEHIVTSIRRHLDAGATRRDAVAAVVAELGVPRRRVYRLAVEEA